MNYLMDNHVHSALQRNEMNKNKTKHFTDIDAHVCSPNDSRSKPRKRAQGSGIDVLGVGELVGGVQCKLVAPLVYLLHMDRQIPKIIPFKTLLMCLLSIDRVPFNHIDGNFYQIVTLIYSLRSIYSIHNI